MKVLFLTNVPAPYRVDFFNELGKYVELTVLFERKRASDRAKSWHVEEFQNFEGIYLKGWNTSNDSAFCPSVLKYMNPKKYDIIIVGGYATPTQILAISYLRRKKIPFVLNADGAFVREESNKKRKIKKYLISSATWWICSGEYTKQTLKHYGADEKKTFTYPFTSIREKDILKQPLSKEEKSLLRKELSISEDKVVLSVGQFIPRKGFDILIKASKHIPEDVGVYIIGGKPTEEYTKLVSDLNLERKVHFIEHRSFEELKKYYMSANLFVLPTREDIWGLVINEAMAFGLPIITTDRCIAGMELIGDRKGGFIVESESVESLANAINEMIENDILSDKMGQENLKTVQSYTIEKMAKAHCEIFEKIMMDIKETK